MPGFRPATNCTDADKRAPSGAALSLLLDEVFGQAHFFIAPTLRVMFTRVEEEIAWEVFQGRLLDPAH